MKRKIACVAVVLLLLVTAGLSAAAEQVYNSYTYDYWGNPVEAPESYTPDRFYLATDMGTTVFKLPQDMFVQQETGRIYVADTGNNRIVILDKNFQLVREIKELQLDPEELGLTDQEKKDAALISASFATPNGLFVDGKGLIYVADTENKRVVICSEDGRVVRLLSKPQSEVNFTGIDFLPMKVVADDTGYTYLLCKGIYHGAVVYTPEGRFSGYFGANTTEVTLSVILDNFWRKLYTAEQRQKMNKYVPIEFSNLDIDEKGFIYTTTLITTTYKNHIKKFNHNSTNVLSGAQVISSQYAGFYGDLERVWYNSEMYESRFTDICYRDGFIHALDMSRGRVFEYDDNGMLVSVFGGIGNQTGTFGNPVAVDALGQNLLVLDAAKGSITVFKPTPYCLKIHSATKAYNEGRYTASRNQWEEILAENSNCQLAYIGIGKAYYESGDYENAMTYFRQGQDREGYGKAYKQFRNERLQVIIPVVVVVLVLLIVIWKLVRFILKKTGRLRPRVKREEKFRRILWVWYTMRHPVKGFTDCKENRRYSTPFALLVSLLLFAVMIVQRQFTGFPFNYEDPLKINVLLIFASTVLLLVLWSIGNWAVSTLLDGKGRMREIFYVTAVSLIPYLLSVVLTVIMSNVLATDEGMFITWVSGFGILWSAFLLFSGLMVLHDYSFLKTLMSVLLTLFLLVVVAFIAVLLFSLFQQTFHFFEDIYNEINFRMMKS